MSIQSLDLTKKNRTTPTNPRGKEVKFTVTLRRNTEKTSSERGAKEGKS